MSSVHSIVAILCGVMLMSSVTGCSKPASTAPDVTKRGSRWNLSDRLEEYGQLLDKARASAAGTVENYNPQTKGQIDDLELNVTELLSNVPRVIHVEGSKVDMPNQRIVHLVDCSLPSQAEFLHCLRKMKDGGIDAPQLESLYDDYRQQIELMQIEQMVVLRCLIKQHGLRRVFVEGVANLPMGQKFSPLEVGTAGQLLMSRELQHVIPLDDTEVSEKPGIKRQLVSQVDNNSVVHSKIRQKKTAADLDQQIRTVLDHGNFGLIVVDDHDLTENVSRISGGKCEYIRVQTKWWNEVSPLDPNVWGR